MKWNLSADRPIYIQLMEQIELAILSGIYAPGTRLPSVRDLSTRASVNPNTMQRALSELERTGLIFSQRTSGRFITDDEGLIKDLRKKYAMERVQNFYQELSNLGYTREEIILYINTLYKEDEIHDTHSGM